MNNHISFGSALREARVAKGYDLDTVARRLRIRPDILDAIEEGDFDRMPPRGYVRNMINAYARLMGLNASDVTRMYLDEAYAYQIGRAHEDATQNRYLHRNTSRPSSRPSSERGSRFSSESYGETPIYGTSTSRGRRNGGIPRVGRTMVEMEESEYASEGRRSYSDDPQRHGYREERSSRYDRTRAQSPEQQVHRSRRSTITDGKYLNLYADGRKKGFDLNGKLPFIIGGVVVLVLLAVILNLTLCSQPQEEPDQIPVTGLDENQGGDDQAQQAPVATPPTQFTLAYNVKEGQSTYIEVYVDGALQEAADVSGPATKQFSSSDTIRFVCSEPDALTLTIDGAEQKLEAGSSGIVNETFTFSKVLDDWYAQHPEVPRAASGASGSASGSTSDAGTAGTGQAGASSSGSASGSSSSASGTSGSGSSSGASGSGDAGDSSSGADDADDGSSE